MFPTLPYVDGMALGPVGILAFFGVLTLILEMLSPKSKNNWIVGVTLLGIVSAGVLLIADFGGMPARSFGQMELHDQLGSASELILLLVALITTLVSEPYLREKKIAFGEFYPLMLWSTAGAMVMSTSSNLLMIFLGLEVLSISLYVLCGLNRREGKSEEAAVKYFLLGAFSSGFLLYGIALVYGATGQLELAAVPGAWSTGVEATKYLLLGGFALIAVGLCFKTALMPFHQWAPDVYEGAPTNVTAFMSAAAKIAAFAAFWRLITAFAPSANFWLVPLGAIAVITIIGGNVLALVQSDVKRILAYSSVAHAGYILVDLLAHAKNPSIGITSMEFYLLSYALMTVGAFAVLTLLAARGREVTKLSDLNGLWKRNPLAAVALVAFMMSLVGLPPFAGFFGKVLIFSDAVNAGLWPLAIVLGVGSVISAGYYLAIAKAAFVDEPSESPVQRPATFGPQAAFFICMVGVIAVSIFIGPIQSFFQR